MSEVIEFRDKGVLKITEEDAALPRLRGAMVSGVLIVRGKAGGKEEVFEIPVSSIRCLRKDPKNA